MAVPYRHLDRVYRIGRGIRGAGPVVDGGGGVMRNLNLLNRYRLVTPEVKKMWGWYGDETCGAFEVPSPIDGGLLRVIASANEGWDHVSVSRINRTPSWPEMEHVRRLFFKDDETAMQLHVPPIDHINQHPHCLHMWRPWHEIIPRPPAIFVGGTQEEADAYIEHGLVGEPNR